MTKLLIWMVLGTIAYGGEQRGQVSGNFRTTAGQTVVHETAVIKIAQGTSVLKEKVNRFAGSPLKVVTIVTASCPMNPVRTVKLHLPENDTWEETNLQNGWDYYSGKIFDAVELTFQQNNYVELNCRVKIYGTGDPLPPLPAVDKLIGALKYNGGFEQSLNLAITPSRLVRYVRFEVPAFCPDVEILEARTTTEGVEDLASAVSGSGGKVFSVNQGNGMRISQVSVALNGPSGQACDIPVFVRE